MPENTGALGRAEIAEAIAQNIGVSRSKARKLVDGITARLGEALESGEDVKIPHFGTFHLIDKPERPGRNPKSGDEYMISSRRVVVFRASDRLRTVVF